MTTSPAPYRAPRPVPGTHLFKIALRPLAAFLRLEAASGLVLLGCAVAALTWANVAGESYEALFRTPFTIGVAGAVAHFSLLQLVNDGLMTLFFFLVGMEIKRELIHGELRTFSQAALPAIAAVGGMVVPAAIFLGFNGGGPEARGWGIPMATDIAFCIGVLTLLKSRVPHALIVFVTALAVFDDIGGILVIAIFYGTGVHGSWLVAAAAVTATAFLFTRAGVRHPVVWLVMGVLLWFTVHHAGIHATIAGVILGLAIPARPARPPREVLGELSLHATALARASADEERDEAAIHGIQDTLEDLESPLTRFVHALHPMIAFGVMPLFALANSGVRIGNLEPAQLTGGIAMGTLLALFLGKQIGIFAFTFAAIKAGIARAPGGASVPKLLGVSIVAGIGFTVALFIASLAYPGAPAFLEQAKVGILAGSLISGVVGAAVLLATAPHAPAAAVERVRE